MVFEFPRMCGRFSRTDKPVLENDRKRMRRSMSETVELTTSDGHTLDAYVARPQGPVRAALIVIQEVFGVNAHIRSVADRFAKHGFLAIAPALFDRIEKHVELSYEGEDRQRAFALMPRLDFEKALLDVEAAIEYGSRETGKPALVVGYCFGGTIAWLSATRLHPAAAVGYYGGNIAKFNEEKPRVPVILHFGREDSHIPLEDVDKIAKAHPEVQVFTYPAGHGFSCDARSSYEPKSAAEAFERTLTFLNQNS
jgi:carboxymethylenebutenolidase